MTAPTAEELNTVAVNRIIESAERVARGEDKAARQRTADVAASVIADFNLPADEYDRVIRRLAEALRI